MVAPGAIEQIEDLSEFSRSAGVAANLAALKKVDSWSQGEFVEKGGWATIPGSNSPQQVTAVAQACVITCRVADAELIVVSAYTSPNPACVAGFA